MKKIPFTPGAGFSGSHLCEELLNKFNAFSLDNYLRDKLNLNRSKYIKI